MLDSATTPAPVRETAYIDIIYAYVGASASMWNKLWRCENKHYNSHDSYKSDQGVFVWPATIYNKALTILDVQIKAHNFLAALYHLNLEQMFTRNI